MFGNVLAQRPLAPALPSHFIQPCKKLRCALIAGTNNIEIGNQGVYSDNNVIRIGTAGTHTDTYLAGTVHATNSSGNAFYGTTATGSAVYGQASSSGNGISGFTSTGTAVLGQCSGSGGWGGVFRYGGDGNNCAYLGANGYAADFYGVVTVNGTFNNYSDRAAKEHFVEIQPADLLAKVLNLPLTEWNYKNEPATRHIGPTAQDFYTAFSIGTDERHIAPMDEGGVALAAIQGLNQKLNEKDAEIQDLKQSVAKLKAMVEKLAGN